MEDEKSQIVGNLDFYMKEFFLSTIVITWISGEYGS